MATILNTTQVYTGADVVTHTNLNNIVGGTTFVAGASGTTDNASLEVDTTSGSLQIKNDGVITAKLPDSTVKTDGVTFPKIQHIDTNKVLGRTSVDEGDVEAIDFIIGSTGNTGLFFDNDDLLDNSDTAGGSATSGATQQSIKAYIDKLKPNIVQSVKSNTFENLDPQNQWNEIEGLSVEINPRFSNSKFLVEAMVSSSTNTAAYGVVFKLVRDTTDIALGDTDGSRTRCSFTGGYSGGKSAPANGVKFLDTPTVVAGTPINYQVQCYLETTVDIYINRSNTNTDANEIPRPISSITVTEIYQ